MLQALSDLFLLISSDTKKITNQDLIIFYNFINKKIQQLDQQFPYIISKSLSNDLANNFSSEKQPEQNAYKLNKDNNTKKLFILFQKQLFNFFEELINFCFKEGLIKLNNRILEKNILAKIPELNTNKDNDNSANNNNNTLKFLIYLVINNKVNCTIYPNNYIKFFNSENTAKKRIIAENFMKLIKYAIKIYKESKRNINSKKVIYTEKKISKTKKFLDINKLEIRNKNKITFNRNNIIDNINITRSEQSIIKNNETDNSFGDESNDTIHCETPKNISSNKYYLKNQMKLSKNLNKSILTIMEKNNGKVVQNFSFPLSNRNNKYFLLKRKQSKNKFSNLTHKNLEYNKSNAIDKNMYKNTFINKSVNFMFNKNFYNNIEENNNDDKSFGCFIY